MYREMRRLILMLLSLLCLGILSAGCGGTGGIGGGSTQAVFDVIKEPGYYQDVIMQPNGEFLARYKVDDAQASSSGQIYKVDFNGDKKIEKITAMYGGNAINATWKDTVDRGFDFAAVTMEYQDGYVKYNFKNSRMAAAPGYYGAYAIRYKIDEEKKTHKVAYFYNKQGEQANTSLGCAQLLFTYDDKGALVKVGYANTNGERVTTVNKDYETRFKYDKGKKPIEVANYGKDDSLMVDVTGIAKTTYKTDDKGRMIEARHFGSDDSLKEKNTPKLHADKVLTAISAGAITKYTYDGDNMTPTKIAFYGKDEQPLGIKAWGNIASYKFKYTKDRNVSEVSTYGADDSPIPIDRDTLGDNVVKLVMSYDDNGNLVKMSFYGKDDNMVVASKLNAAECRSKYDDKRRNTEDAYFGTGEDAINVNEGGRVYHRVVHEYNDDDERILNIYYDKDGNEVARETPAESSAKSMASSSVPSGNDISPYIAAKNQYDQQIAALAKDINAYLSSHKNFAQADGLIARADALSQKIQQTRNSANSAQISNTALKTRLLEVLDAELGRINGLRDGMKASRAGGDHMPGFKRGTDAAYRFDDVNASLDKML